MPYGLYLSAAGANAQNHRLEVVSHNLANVNTPGFKPQLAMLQARQSQAEQRGETGVNDSGVDRLGGGVGIQPSEIQFQQGPIRQTDRKTDFAINDKESFFVVQRGETELLTRAGNFMFDSQGSLVSQHGDPVLSASGGRIRIDPNLPFEVTSDGAIVQGGQRSILRLVKPQAVGDLVRVGDNLFQPLTNVTNVAPEQRHVSSGALENSAVEPTMAMMELIEASRVYEANIRMIQTQNDSLEQLISRVLR
ncbi:MAG: flagellar hook basal-body protein [Pirellulaceae bacterium]|nr:flagellar hook basal-body protein [Pirellulaceae bacterium]